MPGLSRSKNGVASLAYCAGHPRLYARSEQDVDGRHEPGHDEYMSTASLLPSPDLIDRVIATANAYSVSRIRVLQELPGNPVGIEVREIGDDAIALMAKHFPNPNFNRVAGLKRNH